jgi:hypothetical protein
MVVHYEDICRAPRDFVETVGRVFLGMSPDFAATDPSLQSLPIGHRAEGGELLAKIRETFTRLDAAA